jgi:acetoin utilization deacetylase AcuC-like enzyme
VVHTESHVEKMAKTGETSAAELNKLAQSYNSIYLNKDTYKCAEIAAGCVVQVMQKLNILCLESVYHFTCAGC